MVCSIDNQSSSEPDGRARGSVEVVRGQLVSALNKGEGSHLLTSDAGPSDHLGSTRTRVAKPEFHGRRPRLGSQQPLSFQAMGIEQHSLAPPVEIDQPSPRQQASTGQYAEVAATPSTVGIAVSATGQAGGEPWREPLMVLAEEGGRHAEKVKSMQLLNRMFTQVDDYEQCQKLGEAACAAEPRLVASLQTLACSGEPYGTCALHLLHYLSFSPQVQAQMLNGTGGCSSLPSMLLGILKSSLRCEHELALAAATLLLSLCQGRSGTAALGACRSAARDVAALLHQGQPELRTAALQLLQLLLSSAQGRRQARDCMDSLVAGLTSLRHKTPVHPNSKHSKLAISNLKFLQWLDTEASRPCGQDLHELEAECGRLDAP